MANKKDTKKRIDATIKTTPANVVDVFVDYAVQEQIKAADVPPRKRLDISFSDASKIGDKKSDTNQEAYEKAHGKLYNMTHNNTIPWRNYVVYLILLTMLTCCFTFSKYISTFTPNASTATVAKFNFAIKGTVEGVSINAKNQMDSTPTVSFTSNDSKSYTFMVENKSEVAVTVTPSVSGNGGYTISFVDGSNKTVNSSAPLRLTPNQQGTIKMTINPTNATNNASSNMSLSFKVDQVD